MTDANLESFDAKMWRTLDVCKMDSDEKGFEENLVDSIGEMRAVFHDRFKQKVRPPPSVERLRPLCVGGGGNFYGPAIPAK